MRCDALLEGLGLGHVGLVVARGMLQWDTQAEDAQGVEGLGGFRGFRGFRG